MSFNIHLRITLWWLHGSLLCSQTTVYLISPPLLDFTLLPILSYINLTMINNLIDKIV